MEINEVIEQLKDIRCNSKEMSLGDDVLDDSWIKDIKAIDIAIPILEKQSQLEAENITITAENKALKSLLDSANSALKRAGSAARFMLHDTSNSNSGLVFEEKEHPEDVYARQHKKELHQ